MPDLSVPPGPADAQRTVAVTARRPNPLRPLQGLTVLAVEDSRFASEALRLLCLRSGARIRRADSLAAAERHLATYRPDVAIVDLGLPDGCGSSLIRQLSRARARVPVILGLSGRDDARREAMGAGADGFLAKPIPSLAAFQEAITRLLPPELRSTTPRESDPGETLSPDPLALRDDLAHAAEILGGPGPDEGEIDYVAGFLAGIARLSDDPALAEAAAALLRHRRGPPPHPGGARTAATGLGPLRRIIDDRLAANPAL